MFEKSKGVILSGRTWILLGFAILLSSELFVYRESFLLITSNIISQIGIAFMVMGIVGIILQFEDMKIYFQDRLKEIVIQRSYLENLSDNELQTIQIDTLKAKYKNTDIDKEGSFLYYFQNKIQDYIGYPFRENVSSSILIEEDPANVELFKVFDSTNYLCRANNGKIQEEVKWIYDRDEFEYIHDAKLIIRCPSQKEEKCNELCKNNQDCKNGIIEISKQKLDDDFYIDDKGTLGYLVKLENILWTKDQLHIELITSYSIKRDKIFTWAMTHPSKGIFFTISYPNGYKLNQFVGGIEPREYTSSFNGNMYIFKHDGWFLPRTGLAWNLSKQ